MGLRYKSVSFTSSGCRKRSAAKGLRSLFFFFFFRFWDSFGHFSVTFSDASVTFRHFLPDSFCRTPFAAGWFFVDSPCPQKRENLQKPWFFVRSNPPKSVFRVRLNQADSAWFGLTILFLVLGSQVHSLHLAAQTVKTCSVEQAKNARDSELLYQCSIFKAFLHSVRESWRRRGLTLPLRNAKKSGNIWTVDQTSPSRFATHRSVCRMIKFLASGRGVVG